MVSPALKPESSGIGSRFPSEASSSLCRISCTKKWLDGCQQRKEHDVEKPYYRNPVCKEEGLAPGSCLES